MRQAPRNPLRRPRPRPFDQDELDTGESFEPLPPAPPK